MNQNDSKSAETKTETTEARVPFFARKTADRTLEVSTGIKAGRSEQMNKRGEEEAK